MSQRSYRDPLHNIISLDESRPEDRLIVELIDSAEFQRLRRIRQLGLAMFTYQGAEHSRFTHSLGVMHLMTRALGQLSVRHKIDRSLLLAGRAGALLHDLGHGPFSHLIEKVFAFKHEDWTRRIILDESTEVNRLLTGYDQALPLRIASLYDHSFRPAFVSQLVSSQLDCDRMDYLLRDSLMTGVKYGIYDLEWILHTLRIDEDLDQVYVEHKGLHAVEEYLQARYYMFRQVYFHRALRSAEAVLVSTLTRARELISQGRTTLAIRGSAFEKMLVGEQVTTREYVQLDDTDLFFNLKQWTTDSDPVLSDLAGRLVNRRLFKAVDLDMPDEDIGPFLDEASREVAAAGFDPRYYLIPDRASDIPFYGYYVPAKGLPDGLIYVEENGTNHTLREISEVSELVRGMRAYRIERVCFPMEVAGQINRVLAEHAARPA
ncbi:MAG TPA: HD domain-containing protein [Blastocatellia bacterium]|nr:HD domain-containing protein [Blastocatellia bacterium]